MVPTAISRRQYAGSAAISIVGGNVSAGRRQVSEAVHYKILDSLWGRFAR